MTLPSCGLSLAVLLGLSGCSSEPEVIAIQRPSYGYSDPYSSSSFANASNSGQGQTLVSTQRLNSADVALKRYQEVRVRRDFIPTSARGRTGRSMRPRYITIHSTQNWSKGADAWRHSLALKRGKLGRLSWHYTTDENVAVQHLPTNEQGKHADFDGPGNKYSIGIEMCEHPGNSRSATLERTAKLAAWLMYKNDIPISRVVPHYHWPRWGKNPPNKNCPHFLLNNGRPGKKWRAFQAKVNSYYKEIASPSVQTWASR